MLASGAPIIELAGVTKRYAGERGARPALDGIDLAIRRGEVFGVIGESGAGKSTLLQLIAGLEPADAGSVTVAGRDVGTLGRRRMREHRQEIGVLFQGIHLLSSRTVRANVALALRLGPRAAR
ncbi:ATP-binding cassette domain-containing protein, partial [Agrococcus sp. HG114]|uniref:ATP-binding cassette domain-containing protein n=1 Tax=Agrococcus sp. HG114 TaxID=2969757 RepID=UPI00215AFEF7